MIYLFNKHLELTEVLKSPLSATMNRRLVGVDTLSVEESIKNLKVIEESSFAGAFLKNKFYIFKKDKHGSNNNKVYFTGINYAYDELANADVIKDRRLNNVTASVAISAAIQGTGWTLGTIQTTSAQTTNFYYETPLEAIKKVIELWQIEPDFYFDFDGKKITGRKIDVMQQRGRVTGERFVYGSDILEIVQEEDRSDIVTALYGRGKGEEVVDEEGETTGGYSRRITFADVEWKKSKGDPVDKPLGQEYVELPSATQAYGYPKGDGTFKPRFAVYINEQLEEPLDVLKETYRVLVERSRPLVTFSATVAKAGSYDLGDTNYIIRPDLGLSYEARIFEDEIDLLNPDRTKFKFGDYIQSGQAKRLREIKSYFDGLTDKISRVESDTNGKLIKISKDWYDALMEVKEGTFFSGSSYNYSLENGNPYGLPAGFYSFDAPLEGAPTGFLVIQGGKIGRGKVLPNGEWDFNLIGDEDGLTADAIVAGQIKAQFIEIGASSTFLEGYDPSTKANAGDVYTITEIDTKLSVIDGEISSKVSSTTYTSEKPTYGAVAPTTKPVGRLWVDTSVTPNLLKRWNGSSWVIINDTSALTQRIQQAEQKILPNAIISTVKDATDQDGDPLFAKTSEVKQTVDDWTAKFSSIGGANLIKDSNNLWFNSYDGNTVNIYKNMSVPEWGATDATQITIEGNSGGTSDLRAYSTMGLPYAASYYHGKPHTLSVYVKNNRPVGGSTVTIGSLRYGETTVAPQEVKRVVLSGKNSRELLPQLQIQTNGASWFVDITIWHPQFEAGYVATEWTPHPDELYTGITSINKDGVTVGREGETIETNVGFDGLRIKDGTTEIASFLGSGAVINELQAGTIIGDVINTLEQSLTFDIGSGAGHYANFSEVLNAIGNRKHIKNEVKITINVIGILNGNIVIDGFSGGGEIEVNIFNKVNGFIRTSSNSCKVGFYGRSSTHVISGVDNTIVNDNTIISSADAHVVFYNLNVDSKSKSSGIGITSRDSSNIYVSGCDYVNCQDSIVAMTGGKVQSIDNKGNPTRFALYSSSGRIWARGAVPDGENFGFTYTDNITRTPSSFSPPPVTTTTETLIFNHTDIYTYSVAYGERSTHYGRAAAQNRWNATMTQMKGRISFGKSVYNFIAGRNSGTTPTVRLRLRRQNSTHGASSSVAPTPEWSGAPSFGGATRGNWTPWVTIPYTLFTSSGYTFSFYNGSTGNSYAIWDYAQVQITRTITQ